MTVSRALLHALDIARLSERHGDNPYQVALVMIAIGADALSRIGGNEAAGATLNAWAEQIDKDGKLAESPHAPGHA